MRNIPSRLFELSPELRDPIIMEFQIPAQATRCCAACLMRIRRKLDPHINLTDEEHRTDGDESDVSTSSCDERETGGSDTASVESPENPQRQAGATSVNSAGTTTPAGNNGSSSLASNSKDLQSSKQLPVNAVIVAASTAVADTTSSSSVTITSSTVKSDERLLPPLGHAPRKQKTSEEYDSSATETADEENENSPANRQSPKVIVNTNASGASAAVVSSNLAPPAQPPATQSQINGPPSSMTAQNIMLGREPTSMNVQDFLHTVIERSLKQKVGPPPTKIGTSQHQPLSSTAKSIGNSGGLSIEPSSGKRLEMTNQNNNSNSSNAANNDVTIVREFRSDGSIVKQTTHQNQSMSATQQRQNNSNVDSLATLSLVNSHLTPHGSAGAGGVHLIPHSSFLHQSAAHDIKATITPVSSSKIGKTPTPPSHSHLDAPPDTIIYGVSNSAVPQQRNPEPECQTLDLSIKKPSRDGPSPSSSNSSSTASSGIGSMISSHSSSSVKHVGNAPSMYRNPTEPPHGAPTYLYHPASVAVGKAPPPMGAMYVAPVPLSITQPGGRSQVIAVLGSQAQPSSQQAPHQQPPPPQSHSLHMQTQQQQQQSVKTPAGNVNKMPPKLSPQLLHPQSASPSQQQQMKLVGSGPKGSITHGTPVNNANTQQIIQVHSSPATLSPNLMRQTPPSNSGGDPNSKVGSITQGTPIHLPSHHQIDKRTYDYYKSSQRQSPAQQPSGPTQQSSPQAPPSQGFGVNSPYGRSPYGVEPPVLSTRQIVIHDYMTSQQMQGQQRNVSRGSSGSAGPAGTGSDKESPSPRNSLSAVGGNNSGMVMYEYSRVSPADHVNR